MFRDSMAAVGLFIIGIAVVGGAIFGIGYAQSWWLRGPGVQIENAKTDVLHETNQYVLSQQQALNNLLDGYYRASDAQKPYIVSQMHDIADTIQGRVPTAVQAFLSQHPRGSN